MKISRVCVLGATGFVGRALGDQLFARGIGMRVVTRQRPRAAPLMVLPTVEVQVADCGDVDDLVRCFDNVDAVVNLVGVLHPSRRQSFEHCHVEVPRKVVQACHAAGVRHLVQMSALAASDDAPSAYLRSRAAGEAAVRQAAGILPVTIFRPSVIFGEGDAFLNTFAKLVKLFPVIPLAGAKARFQPIWVEDVARCIADSLGNTQCFGQTYELAGPRRYTLAELVQLVAQTTGKKRSIVALPGPLASLQAFMLEHLPGKLMTRDNLASMSVDNVTSQPFPEVFGFRPSALEAVVPEYLAGSTSRSRYPQYRHNAGR